MFVRFAMAFALVAVAAGCAGQAVHEDPADAAISRSVLSALADHNIGRDYSHPIHVVTTHGAVKLNGFVWNNEQVYSAGAIAARVPGVTHVENHLLRMPPIGSPERFPGRSP